jgi:site-specific recombinase XerD
MMLVVAHANSTHGGAFVSLGVKDWREDESAFVVMGKGLRQRLAIMPDERSLMAVRTYSLQRVGMNLGHDALLVNPSGRRLSSQGVARVVAATAEAAALEIRVTPHMIRHTIATLLLRAGADIRIVQEVLGHASIATTQRYTYVSKEHLIATLHAHHPNNHLNIKLPARAAENQLVLPLS